MTHVAALHFIQVALIQWDTSSSILPDLWIIDPRYLNDSFGCKILSPIQTSTPLFLLFNPSADFETSTISSVKIQHHVPSKLIPLHSLNHPLPKLHDVTKNLDTPIVAANMRITFVLVNWDDFIECPFFWHHRACENLVEETS
ncbi:hypothetical protein Tco_0139908 [Tanacetum coccineum]